MEEIKGQGHQSQKYKRSSYKPNIRKGGPRLRSQDKGQIQTGQGQKSKIYVIFFYFQPMLQGQGPKGQGQRS